MQIRSLVMFASGCAVLAAGLVAGTAPAEARVAPMCTKAAEFSPVDSDALYELPVRGDDGDWTCTLQYGDKNTGVRALQRSLNGCYSESLALDGSFGPATRAAVRRTQALIGAKVDGGYGPEMLEKMLWFSPSTGRCVRF